MSAPDAELRELVRKLVLAALQRASGESSPAAAAPASALPSRRLLVLFMSREAVSDEFLAQLATVSAQGYGFTAAFSRTFAQVHSPDAVLSRLPVGTPGLTSATPEPDLLQATAHCHAVIAHAVTANTAAKVSQGIDDSLPSLLVRHALLAGRPVFIARDLPQLEREFTDAHPAAAPALVRATVDAFHRLQNVGARFIGFRRLASEVAAAFHQPVNETPARLARTKPSPKRVFVTAEDVWTAAASGHSELTHPRDAVVTDAARDEAAARGVTLVSQ